MSPKKQPAPDSVLVLSCGGTFDKSKFTRAGKFVCGSPQATEMLAKARVEHCPVTSLMRKDSLDMDDADRAQVIDSVRAASERRVVVVHGTDTLIKTAMALHAAEMSKVIVLVGSMSPAVFTGSDATFNLGFALGVANAQPVGVWVAMHGQVWPADSVRKDTERQCFVSA